MIRDRAGDAINTAFGAIFWVVFWPLRKWGPEGPERIGR